MAIVISGNGIDMGGNPVSNASQVDGAVINENGAGVATENQVGTANSALVKTALNANGNAPVYACRAWVNFNGTGTVAIRASGNVSSITDNGVGEYTVNFTTAMSDVGYSSTGNVASNVHKPTLGEAIHSTTQLNVSTGITNVSYSADISIIEVQVFR